MYKLGIDVGGTNTDMTTDVPASILQLHPNCEFLLDEAAASMLNC